MPRISPVSAVTAIASGTHDSHAHGVVRKPLGLIWFHGLSGLVSSATV